MKNFIQKYFKFKENNTNFRKEISGGMVTFLTMSYIIFVQPGVLKQAGMDFSSVMIATCLSAAIAFSRHIDRCIISCWITKG